MNLRSALSVFLVTAASGLLFHASATTASQSGAATDGDLVNLVRHRQAVVAELEAERDAIANQVAEHSDTDLAAPLTSASASNFNRSAISGPGVVITLTDAPAGDIPEGATPNDLVIHQQDIEDVMNALWDGGAEAMTVQGVRVSSRTVIRCIGNVILVDGASYSPPYEIAAIGDISALVTAVETNPRVVNYMQYVALYKMGWKLEKKEVMHMPAASTDATVSYAKVVE
nr:DUF881 domain-containing protein [Schaalia suimastitidis]